MHRAQASLLWGSPFCIVSWIRADRSISSFALIWSHSDQTESPALSEVQYARIEVSCIFHTGVHHQLGELLIRAFILADIIKFIE